MAASIFITKKLEKLLSKNISDSIPENVDCIGKWNANVFYIKGKKCWMLVNKLTRYALILSDIKKSDLKNISEIFIDTLYNQLIWDGIEVKKEKLHSLIGEIKLLKTDNDRSVNGSINSFIMDFDYWKREFGTLENMNMRDLNGRLNRLPLNILNWDVPNEKMRELIKTSV
jgi:IS30 family transposase